MQQNPSVINYDSGYAIRFVRRSWKVLIWVQDLSERKLKNTVTTTRPVVLFPSKEEAEREIKEAVIPWLQGDENITGW
jgi:hypothetical protein